MSIKEQICDCISKVYEIEDCLEKLKTVLSELDMEREYDMVVTLQDIFNRRVADKIKSMEQQEEKKIIKA